MALVAAWTVCALFADMFLRIWSDIHNIYSTYILNYPALQGRVLCPILQHDEIP